MRLFLIGADPYEVLELKKRSHEILYWVGMDKERVDIPGTIFHDHYAAWSGIPAEGVDVYKFPPPSQELIGKLYRTESLVLTMMNKKYGENYLDEKKHLYYEMLRYWDGVIHWLKPEAIYFPIIPHTVYNYIIHELAKLYNIKTVMLDDSWVSDRLLIYQDWRKGSERLLKRISANQGKNFTIDDLDEDLRQYFKTQTEKENDTTPIYMKFWKEQNSGYNLFLKKIKMAVKSAKNGTIIKKSISYLIKQFKPNLKKEYREVETNPNLVDNFIYFPLSFQPERTTSPQGDIFADQLLAIETLSASLPDGWKIYVKEHPSQWWLRTGIYYSCVRFPGYYRKIASIKNVQLVPIHTDSFNLIEHSRAVAVVTGTAGWEAILRLKPILIFGYPWYRDFPGLFRVNDWETCAQAFKKVAEGYEIKIQEVINFLKCFNEATIHGYIEGFVNKISKLSKKESMDNIINILSEEFK